MAQCRKEVCSKNIQCGVKVTRHLMFNILPPWSSGFCATLCIRFGIQSWARSMSAYFCVVWDFENISLFSLQEDLQNFYTLKILKHKNKYKRNYGILQHLKKMALQKNIHAHKRTSHWPVKKRTR